MGRESELDTAAADYVPVRITNLAELDVANLRFDFDLTFAAVLMHADGTVYHRYGSRGPDAADGYLSLSSLAQLLRDTLPEHREYDRAPKPPAPAAAQRAIELPWLQQRLAAGQKIDCVHCHTVNDAEFRGRGERFAPDDDDVYRFPDPARVGISLDREHQRRVTAVRDGSPAAEAGIVAGDELLALGAQRSVRTLADVQWALHHAPAAGGALPIAWRRDGAEQHSVLTLPAGWKRCDPADFAWRPYKWNLSPAPGFGGPALTAAEKRRLGVADDRFAFRVNYLVDWGDRANRGKAARAAGLQKGDVVVSFAGKDDFASVEHFHAWVRLTRAVGEQVELVVLRNGERHTLRYALPR
ncbi:MAG: PDZ domain-containing protein [Planctomycetes bacterium]|nr:PDZ domain-containing protein [Planctomycetota bacterium]